MTRGRNRRERTAPRRLGTTRLRVPPGSALNHYAAQYKAFCGAPGHPALGLMPRAKGEGVGDPPAVALVIVHEAIVQQHLHPEGTSGDVISRAVAAALGPGLMWREVRALLGALPRPWLFTAEAAADEALDAYALALSEMQSIREQHPFPGGAPVIPLGALLPGVSAGRWARRPSRLLELVVSNP